MKTLASRIFRLVEEYVDIDMDLFPWEGQFVEFDKDVASFLGSF